MLAVLITGAVVSKGYQEEPAIKFSDSGKAVWFRVGKKVYDPQEKDNRRWVNISIKGFGYMVERVQKMQLKEGVYINIRGRLDEDVWTDKNGDTRKSLYVVAEDIEYAGGKVKDESEDSEPASQRKAELIDEKERLQLELEEQQREEERLAQEAVIENSNRQELKEATESLGHTDEQLREQMYGAINRVIIFDNAELEIEWRYDALAKEGKSGYNM